MALFKEHKFELFLERVNKSNNVKLLNFIEEVGKKYTLECADCKKSCFLYEYGQNKGHTHGMWIAKCTKCITQSKDPFKQMVHDMKQSTQKRNGKGRNHGPVFYDAGKLKDYVFIPKTQ